MLHCAELSSEAGKILLKVKKRNSQFFQLTTHSELPYSIIKASIASFSVEEKKDINAPAKQLFHQG